MGTVVHQGLHESGFEPIGFRLRLSSPQHYSSLFEFPLKSRTLDSCAAKFSDDSKCQYEEVSQKTNTVQKFSHTSPDSGGWSFLQALDDSSDKSRESKKQSTYVHPLVKRKSSALSEKSLELCTESLGSETGTDIIEDSIFSSLSETNPIETSHEGNSPTREQKKMESRQVYGADEKASYRSFPPPLTTMSGSNSIQVRPHREDGRLVIEAIKKPSTQVYFHAERSHGRLRLTFVKDFTSIFDSTNATSTEDHNEEEEKENDVVDCDSDQEHEEQQEEEAEDDEIYEDEMDCNYNMEVGDEMEEFQRPNWCKQGELENQKRLISKWEHLCVATS